MSIEIMPKAALTGRIPMEETERLLALGFIQNKGSDKFDCKVITNSGVVDVVMLRKIAMAAEIFGTGNVNLTREGNVEIMGIPYDKLDEVQKFCKNNGLVIGGTGPKIRPIVTCQGANCSFGVLDSYALSEKIREMFFVRLRDLELPNKFEIAVSGCPTNCVLSELYDVGIIGIKIPSFEMVNCRGCLNCTVERACPSDAAHVTDGVIKINNTLCDKCGLCVGKCPFGAVTNSTSAYKIYIGGEKSKKIIKGQAFRRVFTNEEAVLSVLVRLIYFYQEQGKKEERFGELVRRIGFDNIEKEILR